MAKRIDRLLFIFNANSGVWNAVLDSAKKILQINGCSLCSLTHSIAGEKSEWKTCKEEFGVPIEYVHRDEVTEELKSLVQDNLPTIVAESDGDFTVLLDPGALERSKGSIQDLRGKILFHATSKELYVPVAE